MLTFRLRFFAKCFRATKFDCDLVGTKITASLTAAFAFLLLVGCQSETSRSLPTSETEQVGQRTESVDRITPVEISKAELDTRFPQPGSVFRDCPDCPEMVVIPAGSFLMGSSADDVSKERIGDNLSNRERPQHKVTIGQPFSIGKYTVTRQEFAVFLGETNYVIDGCYTFNGTGWGLERKEGWQLAGVGNSERHPMICVNWYDAQAYINWLNAKIAKAVPNAASATFYRLPSEAEWEYAARAGTTSSRYWGAESDLQCGYANGADQATKKTYPGLTSTASCNDGYANTAPVGSFRPNPFGLYDMLGNVWQWTADCWTKSYATSMPDGSADPTGDCKARSVRGGSWLTFPGFLRSASRESEKPEDRSDYLGFRVVKTLHPGEVSVSNIVSPQPVSSTSETEVRAPLISQVEPEQDFVLVHLASFKLQKNAERAWRESSSNYDLRKYKAVYLRAVIPNGKQIIRVFAKGSRRDASELCKRMRSDGIICHLFDTKGKTIIW